MGVGLNPPLPVSDTQGLRACCPIFVRTLGLRFQSPPFLPEETGLRRG